MRVLLLDEGLPASLAGELRARGRSAVSVAEAGLAGAGDADVLDHAREADAVLVTTVPLDGFESTVAFVNARSAAARREVVHRHAHLMAAQRPGLRRRYPR